MIFRDVRRLLIQQKNRKQTLKSSRYEFKDSFLGWPTDEKLEGYTIESLLEEEHRVSESDRHPNAPGQVRIAEILYEKINSKWL